MSGYVYFIGPNDWRHGVVKIGVTGSHPRKRLSSFQTGSPAPLEIYAFVAGDGNLEKLLHSVFAPVRSHGEWFRMDGKLLALVSDLYGQAFGRRPMATAEFLAAVDGIIGDEPPCPEFCDQTDWIESVDEFALMGWRADVAWATACAQGETIQ